MLKKAITFSSLLLLSSAVFSQTVDQLKKENKKLKSEVESKKLEIKDLKAQVEFCNSIDKNKEVIVKSFTDFYTVKVVKCKGNKTEQTVTLDILVSQSKVNQYFRVEGDQTKAVDLVGNSYNSDYRIYVGGDKVYHTLLTTDTPIKCSIKFMNILPGIQMFKTVSIVSRTSDANGSNNMINGIIELNNVIIEW